MICILLLFWTGLVSSFEQQYYDRSSCSWSTRGNPGSRYTCNNGTSRPSCDAFLLYRANHQFRTISEISRLFGVETDGVLALNNLTSDSDVLELDWEVLLPVKCSCSGEFYRVNVIYLVRESLPSSSIACDVFEGLVKSFALAEENRSQGNSSDVGSELLVPINCACPSNDSLINTNYFLTYPFKSGDDTIKLAEKFGVRPSDVWEANHVDYRTTVFPNTTALVPLTQKPVIAISSSDSSPPEPTFLPAVPEGKSIEGNKIRKLYIAGSVAGIVLIVFGLISCGLYIKALKRLKARKFLSISTPKSSSLSYLSPQTGSPTSCLSPDLLVGIKYSLHRYSMVDLRRATDDFGEDSKVCGHKSLYRGSIDGTMVMIQRLRFKETCWVIDAHARINHINVLNLLGICYGGGGKTDNAQSFFVFEFPGNGSLRDCLARQGTSLSWQMRKHIAFDIVTGLHYLHYSIIPSYARATISTADVFITADWRAKLGNIAGTDISNYFSGSYTSKGTEKAGIFTFGVVLLELISGKAMNNDNTINRKKLQDSVEFLGGGEGSNSTFDGGCFEQLRQFIDPTLKDDYPLAEALCFAVLAKACVADDPLHRPSMDDILKVLAGVI